MKISKAIGDKMNNKATKPEYDKIAESFIENLGHIREIEEMDSYEKLMSLIHMQSLHLIKAMSMNEAFPANSKYDFLFNYSADIINILQNEYDRILEGCIKENLIKEDVDKKQIYEAIQSIIVYFNLSYYQAKKIGSLIEYLEEAIQLLFQGLKKNKLIK
jgi:hypothetical protein